MAPGTGAVGAEICRQKLDERRGDCGAPHLQRSILTALRWVLPSGSAASSTRIGPTSQLKKRGVMRAFSSAPQRLYGKARRNQGGT